MEPPPGQQARSLNAFAGFTPAPTDTNYSYSNRPMVRMKFSVVLKQ